MTTENNMNDLVELIKKKLSDNEIKHYVHIKNENGTKIVEFKKVENERTFLGLFFFENEPIFSDVVLLPINDFEMFQYLGIFIGSQIKVFLQHKNDNNKDSYQPPKFDFLIDKPIVYLNIETACDGICELILSQIR